MMRPTEGPSSASVVIVGLALLGVYVAATFLTMARTPYDLWGAMLIGPVLIALTIPALAREAKRQGDRRLLAFLIAVLLLHLLGALLRYWVTFVVYGGGDASGYNARGQDIAEQFWGNGPPVELESFGGTDWISLFTGIAYIVIGPSKLGGFLFFSWLSFLGLFMFYRAFVVAVPQGDRRWYGLLVFLIPSLVYWPSSIGKEAWMVFTLGIAAIGVARLLTGRVLRGVVLLAIGTGLAAIVRPHVGGLIAIAALGGCLFLRPTTWGRAGPVLKWIGVACVLVLSAFLVVKTADFLGADVLSTQGIVDELQQVSTRSDSGGSRYAAVVVSSPADIPLAVVTVLFRPFVFEVNNAQALAAAVESTLLLVLVAVRLRWIWAAITSLRRIPYAAFALFYSGAFIVVFASFPNFGLLARERVQLLPLFFVLLSIPPSRTSEPLAAPTPSASLPRATAGARAG